VNRPTFSADGDDTGVPEALQCRSEAIAHLNAEQLDTDYWRVAEWYEECERSMRS